MNIIILYTLKMIKLLSGISAAISVSQCSGFFGYEEYIDKKSLYVIKKKFIKREMNREKYNIDILK